MNPDRFAFENNLQNVRTFDGWLSSFWPPSPDYKVFFLNLRSKVPAIFGEDLSTELSMLNLLVDANWQARKTLRQGNGISLGNAGPIAECLRRISSMLSNDADRRVLEIRANAVESGYDDTGLSELARTNEEISFVAGNISTWYGKQKGGLPTAFGCIRDDQETSIVEKAYEYLDECGQYLFSLHKHLRLGSIPAFSPTQIFFMAGEGNRHPKHIAYFLPEDEGIKRSPFKKTYYFVNTHKALVDFISIPLAKKFLNIKNTSTVDASTFGPIPTLGVLSHEFGHAVHLEGKNFSALNAADRWASVVLQEAAADVFGILMVAEVLAFAFQISKRDVIMYHLAECLRYTDRGLGIFPDSDGMYLQLNYLARFGALTVDSREAVLTGDPDVIIAGYRSMGRVLADTLLASDVNRSRSLFNDYGPKYIDQLSPLISKFRAAPPKTIEYLQEFREVEGETTVNRSHA